jgi:radical SAM/Cys-rich protein
MQDTRPLLLESDFPPVERAQLETLQVNLGYLCNMSCVHCHVDAGPTRTELMDLDTVGEVLSVLEKFRFTTLDLTGGAPELNPHFRHLVKEARAMGVRVIDRCNLTVLFEPGQEDLAEFLAQQNVEITASLPCYLEDNVQAQRGKGAFDSSIRALHKLNELGYGDSSRDNSRDNKNKRILNLVYNPIGPVLPPPQAQLEEDYRQSLGSRFNISFNRLLALTNMPISRFGAVLLSRGEYSEYMSLLRNSFSAANMDTLMCRSLVSVDWRGYLYDCDFNQMLDIPLLASDRRHHLRDLLTQESLENQWVATGEHCYGCTAGQGSSCSGALDA